MVNSWIMTLIIHVGAGNHGTKRNIAFKRLLNRALCQLLMESAALVIEKLELLNLGYGSSLNLLGQVECDASFIIDHRLSLPPATEVTGTNSDGPALNTGSLVKRRKVHHEIPISKRGSVVLVYDSDTPLMTAIDVFDAINKMFSERRLLQYGISTPIAINYRSLDLDDSCYKHVYRCHPEDLILPHAKRFYESFLNKLIGSWGPSDTIGVTETTKLVTKIGALSGGNFFKVPGRIGCAGELGSSIDLVNREGWEISCMCSGNGEDIMSMKMANFVVSSIDNPVDVNVEDIVLRVQKHLEKFHLQGVDSNLMEILYIGMLVTIRNISSGAIRLLFCHLTESFYFGFTDNGSPRVVLSQLDNPNSAGNLWAMGEFHIE